MNKAYQNRQMTTETAARDRVYFFPKNNPPVSIRARSAEEAERQLAALNKKEDE